MRGQRALLSARASTTLGTRRRFREAQGENQSSAQFTLKQNLIRAHTLIDGGSLEATVCKDRVYALLGISSDAEALDIPIRTQRDYTHQQLFTSVARKLIQRGNIDLLSYCRSSSQCERDESLPSWVPDWTQPIALPWESAAEDGLFKASIGRYVQVEPETSVEADPQCIKVTAYHVGKVSDLLRLDVLPDGTRMDSLTRNRVVMDVVKGLLKQTGGRYTLEDREQGEWRIPIADRELNDLGQNMRATEKSKRDYEQLCRMYGSLWGSLTALGTALSYLEKLAENADRALIMLDNKFIGLAPAGTQKNDEVWVPSGAHVPYVFRGTPKGQYTLVGSAFVYRMMDGEIFKMESPARCEVLTVV